MTTLPMEYKDSLHSKFKRGLPTVHNEDEEEEYTRYILEIYREKEYRDEWLLEAYCEDFESFTQGMFRALPTVVKRDLRDHLIEYGVNVPTGRGIKIAAALFQVLTEDFPVLKNEKTHKNGLSVKESDDSKGESKTKINDGECDVKTAVTKFDSGVLSSSQVSSKSSYAIANLVKTYSNEKQLKYSGAMSDDFEAKYRVFTERCEQYGVTEDSKVRVFSAMLTGYALEYYFSQVKGVVTDLDSMVGKVKKRFLTEERTICMTQEWDSISFSKYIADNPNCSKKDVLDKMVARLQKLQISLPKEYKSEVLLKNKLLSACADVEECRLARQKVSPTVEGVIADLHTSIATSKSFDKPSKFGDASALLTALITERKRFNRYKVKNKPGKNCYVCGKSGCWSTNHTTEERLSAFRKNKKYRAYIADSFLQEDKDGDDDETYSDADAFNVELDHYLEHLECNDQECEPMSNFTQADGMFLSELQDFATVHAISKELSIPRSRRYERGKFYGIAIDTCCSYKSVGSYEQYLAYCSYVGVNPKINSNGSRNVGFGLSNTTSRGIAVCKMPIGKMIIAIEVQIVDADIPILLSLADLDKHHLLFDNMENTLTHVPTGAFSKVRRIFGHPFVLWNPFTNCLFSKGELSRLHRRFGHPSTEKLHNLLKKIEPEKMNKDTRKILEEVVKFCKLCQFNSQKPRRFKFTLREDKIFNHTIYVDVVTIRKKNALHVVDEATRYQAARWLPTMSADDVWRSLRMCWIDVYLGPPDMVAHDAGKNFIARAFQMNTRFMNIRTKPIPVESPNSMSFVERYHTPLKRAFEIIRIELPDLSDEEILQYAVKSLNDSVGPEGLVPTLLVYGALPRLGFPTDKPAKGIYERAVAVKKASDEMSKYFAKRQYRDAMKNRNGPDVSEIHKAPIGSNVLVYRTKNNSWDGPFTLLNLDNETCTVQCRDGPKQFRTTVVKLYNENVNPKVGMRIQVYWPSMKQFYPGIISSYNDKSDKFTVNYDDGDIEQLDLSKENWHVINNPKEASTAYSTFNGNEFTHCKNEFTNDLHVYIRENKSIGGTMFRKSREKEILGLLDKGVFEPVPVTEAKGHRIFGSRFVDEIKNIGTTSAYPKSRLVVQGHNDKDHGYLTHAPTVQRSSQRLLLALTSILPDWNIYLRDITQAYTQSLSTLSRNIYVKPVTEFGLSKNTVLRVRRPLYGVPEAGLHWFNTYQPFHKEQLGMTVSSHDMCLLFTKNGPDCNEKGKPAAVTCLQTDDSLFLSNEEYRKLEEEKSTLFERKAVSKLGADAPLKFNGMIVKKLKDSITVHAAVSDRNLLNCITTSTVNKDDYVSQRARGAYIASICRPDLSYGFSVAAQYQNPDSTQARALNKVINRCKEFTTTGLRFVGLDESSLCVGVFIDAAFANNPDYSSQLGFITTLMDKNNTCNIVHYGSVKCKRVTRSALASELYAMVHGFDQSYVVKVTIDSFLGKCIPLNIYTDSKSLFDSLVTLNTTSEKRLLIDLSMLRESYERREIANVYWIPSEQNPADGLTKKGSCDALNNLVSTNNANITPNAWIERPTKKWKSTKFTMEDTESSITERKSSVALPNT